MSVDAQEAALAAFHEQLQAVPGIRGAHRNPGFQFNPDTDMDCIAMVDGGDDTLTEETGAAVVGVRVFVGLFVKGGRGETGSKLRAFRRAVLDRFLVSAGGDPTLGGAAIMVEYLGSADPSPVMKGNTVEAMVWVLSFEIQVQEPDL